MKLINTFATELSWACEPVAPQPLREPRLLHLNQGLLRELGLDGAAIAALLLRLGVVEAGDPQVTRWLNPVQKNWRGLVTGEVRAAAGLQ